MLWVGFSTLSAGFGFAFFRFQKAIFEKNLTLNRLSEAISTPRVPERGECVRYDLNLPPSVYVANDIELLMRLENLLY